MSRLEICLAETEEAKEEVYRFRYDIYVREMGRRQIHADHSRGMVIEPLDERGRNYAAKMGGRIVGTIRGNTFDDPAAGYYLKFYAVDRFGPIPPNKLQFTTKLMVLPSLRGSAVGPKMIQRYAAEAYVRGIQVDFLDCNKHLIELFERLGYFSYRGWGFHKEYGTVRPMFLALDAPRYMRRLGSLLAAVAEQTVHDDQYNGYALIERHAELPRTASVRSVTRECFRHWATSTSSHSSHDNHCLREHVGSH